jgi:rhodanese-related sulfurtransferase
MAAPNPRFHQLVADAKTRIREISAADAVRRQAAGAMLVDVREADDFAKEHAVGAVGLSKGVVELKIEEHAPDLNAEIICYCGGGSRSALVADNLQKMGYTNVQSMAGGFKAWRTEGLPTANG